MEKTTSKPVITFHNPDWLEWLTGGLCIWLLIYPHPYTLVFTLVLTIPVIGLIVTGISRPSIASLVSISVQDGKNKYDLADFIEFPGLIILLRVLLDFQFESFYSILKVGTIGFVILLVVLLVTHRLIQDSDNNKWVIYLSVIGNIAIYSYAGTYGVNCVYDNSNPKVYPTKVIGKSISYGKHTTYYLKVEPWPLGSGSKEISVPSSQYNEIEIGQTVSIDYKKGLLGIPWYYVE
jgi:hypothetical protein